MSKKPQKYDSDPKITGPQWDEMEEFDNPISRCWL